VFVYVRVCVSIAKCKHSERNFSISKWYLGRLGHEFLFRTIGAEDVRPICNKAFPHQAGSTFAADEALVVPVSILERDELGAADACYGLCARVASLGEEVTEAFGAERLVVLRRESLSSQAALAIGTTETFSVPRLVLVGHTTA
jgi:hypothetical protein